MFLFFWFCFLLVPGKGNTNIGKKQELFGNGRNSCKFSSLQGTVSALYIDTCSIQIIYIHNEWRSEPTLCTESVYTHCVCMYRYWDCDMTELAGGLCLLCSVLYSGNRYQNHCSHLVWLFTLFLCSVRGAQVRFPWSVKTHGVSTTTDISCSITECCIWLASQSVRYNRQGTSSSAGHQVLASCFYIDGAAARTPLGSSWSLI